MPVQMVSRRPQAGSVERAASGEARPIETTEADVIYFSSVSGFTARFVGKLESHTGKDAARIPLYGSEPALKATRAFVLILPTYGGGNGEGAVPKQVIKFLNDPDNRALLRGVIAGGNTNFGEAYGLAGDIVAAKCQVPVLYRFELFGTQDDVEAVAEGLELFWTRQ